MSASEIIAELKNLSRSDLEAVETRLHELLTKPITGKQGTNWGQALGALAGSVEGLPEDFALNHDHYLHGTPKR